MLVTLRKLEKVIFFAIKLFKNYFSPKHCFEFIRRVRAYQEHVHGFKCFGSDYEECKIATGDFNVRVMAGPDGMFLCTRHYGAWNK